jgi:tRNA(Leu) C34 or U34 (ribose-2'-O)-methylase TrmL
VTSGTSPWGSGNAAKRLTGLDARRPTSTCGISLARSLFTSRSVEEDVGKQRQFKMPPFKQVVDIVPQTPAVLMYNPRYPHNVGAAVRASSCFGIGQVWIANGLRMATQVWTSQRLPREERMKGFSDVDMILEDRPFDQFDRDVTPVAVELLQGAENLFQFEHPEKPLYVFGPEDGSIPSSVRGLCHRRVFLPTRHCTNLGAAVYLLLYDRAFKRVQAGLDPILPLDQMLAECRGGSPDEGWPLDSKPEFVAR